LIGLKGGKWSSISVGAANEIREEYKFGTFEGFDRIQYLDTSGGRKRKRGKPSASPKKKTLEKGK